MNDNIRSYNRPVTRYFTNSDEKKEVGLVDKSFYTINIVSLFSFYIPNPNLLLDRYSGLEWLRRYRIFSSLDPILYLTNCFVYALEQ